MQLLIKAVLQWGKVRGLHNTEDLQPQLTKLIEELGEVAAGVARHDEDRILDGVGDLLVVLINFGAVYNNRFVPDHTEECFLETALKRAWHEIKDRRGETVDGVFVKEE